MNKEEILQKAKDSNKGSLETVSLNRLIEIDSELLSDEDIKARAGDCELFYNKHFEKVIDAFILEELKYLGNEAQNEYMLLFARGHIEAYNKIKNWFIQQKSLSLSRFNEENQEGIL